MRHLLHLMFPKLLSPGEKAAVDALHTEHLISYHHRQGLKSLQRNGLSRPKRLNLGSGSVRKEGFLNVDLFPGGDLTLDLRRGLPFESGCCEMVFSEHFFEHVDYPEPVSHLLRECLRVLQPGGRLRFIATDSEWPLNDYRDGPEAPYFRACRENPWWHPGDWTTRLEHINYHFRPDGAHRFAYDMETAEKLLKSVGFAEIRRSTFDPSLDAEHRRVGSLFIEAKKPS